MGKKTKLTDDFGLSTNIDRERIAKVIPSNIGGSSPINSLTVSSVSPSTGSIAGNTSVTITGTGFLTGAIVYINGLLADSINVVSATSITCKTPASSTSGAKNVDVVNPFNYNGTLANGFTYLGSAPTVSSINPTSGSALGGTSVTITGTGFVTGAQVEIDSNPATSENVVNSTTITAVTPSGTAGAKNVKVTNPDTQFATLNSAFTYLGAPTVTSVTPSSGSEAGSTAVVITGTGFINGATVTFDGTPATSVTFVNSTTINCNTPAGTGQADIVVTNPDTQSGTLLNGYTYISGNVILESAAVAFNNTSSTSITLTKPPGTVDGDLLVASFFYGEENVAGAVSPPAGWTLVTSATGGANNTRFLSYRKVASSEGSSWTWTPSLAVSYAGIVHRISGQDVVTPVGNSSTSSFVNSTTYTAPSVTATAGSLILLLFGGYNKGTASGYTNGATVVEDASVNQDYAIVSAYKTPVGAGATGTFQATASNSGEGLAVTIEIKTS